MALPLVAILGRPNVGKSTLFNRVIKRRKAIVDDMPGVTRDRNYAQCYWGGSRFEVVDTGGYVVHTHDGIEIAVREQVEYSIQGANLVLFVLDVETGITDIDQQMIQMLRKSDCTVLPVINKVDRDNRDPEADLFYRLGYPILAKVSALTGRGIGDMLDLVVEKLQSHGRSGDATVEEEAVKIAVVGRPNVGKSSYVNAILGEKKMIVTDTPGTTRDAIDSFFRYKKRLLCLIDTAGLRKNPKRLQGIEFYSGLRALRSIERCDVVFLMVDAQDGIHRQDLKILQYTIQRKRGVLILLNKWDLLPNNQATLKELTSNIHDQLRSRDFVPWITTSAVQTKRVFKCLDMGITIYDNLRKQLPTGELNRVVQDTMSRVKPPNYHGKKVSVKYVSQVHTAPPILAFFMNHPRGFNAEYCRYLEKGIRARFGFDGVPLTFQFRKK